MRHTTLLLVIQIGLLTACQQTSRKDDSDKLKLVLEDYFGGIKTKNLQQMNDVTTTDFILYEDGKIFNNDSLINLLNTFPKFTAEYTFDNFKIKR
jgi:hypothetical protein